MAHVSSSRVTLLLHKVSAIATRENASRSNRHKILFFTKLSPTITINSFFKENCFIFSTNQQAPLTTSSPKCFHCSQLNRHIYRVIRRDVASNFSHLCPCLLVGLIYHPWTAINHEAQKGTLAVGVKIPNSWKCVDRLLRVPSLHHHRQS